jgi:hypothetical protein
MEDTYLMREGEVVTSKIEISLEVEGEVVKSKIEQVCMAVEVVMSKIDQECMVVEVEVVMNQERRVRTPMRKKWMVGAEVKSKMVAVAVEEVTKKVVVVEMAVALILMVTNNLAMTMVSRRRLLDWNGPVEASIVSLLLFTLSAAPLT